ncbi:DUF6438 domain-containing protein [Hymenobacter sp. 15J16-1T3B]|uniref:DUF6438 domain-containing protein n=1 Tax=Hymenobacter sp. 15J16-1T3B TaxID=2886941 RepID=UPI001D0F92E4|nr:DUF6438 domain-containing protein [Hymenobacter sp. 15J16-1T3B]MCC3157452.1 DUF6438 domain-containing protein [Hymenobacter sp. 15J16-1T3B]
MRANLLPLALGALLLGSLSACSVNYYVGGTRYQQAPPQPGYDYDYPATQPGPVVVVPGPTSQPPIRTAPPVRNPPVRTPPVRTTPGTGHGGGSGPGHSGGSGAGPSTPPNAGGGTLPTAPPKPIPGQTTTTGPTRQPVRQQPDLLPTAPPKPMPSQSGNPGPTRQPPVKQPDLLPTAPPKPMPEQAPSPGPTRQPVKEKDSDLLPTAPPKPMPTSAPQGEAVPASGTELLPTAPPKPAPSHSEQAPAAPEPTKEPDLLPTAPPKPAPQNESEGAGPRRRGRVEEGAEKTPLGVNQGAPAQAAGAPVLVLRKTPCLGPCPHFEASIYADGRVHYVGYRNVAKVGTYELQLPADAVREMMRRADEIGFSNFQDQYVSGATDMPSTYLTYNRPGQPGKTVQVEEGAPGELMGLLNYVGNLVDSVSGGVNPDR